MTRTYELTLSNYFFKGLLSSPTMKMGALYADLPLEEMTAACLILHRSVWASTKQRTVF